jgi:hypothetical protein
MTDPSRVLGYLADLAPRGAERRTVVRRRSDLVHLGWTRIGPCAEL